MALKLLENFSAFNTAGGYLHVQRLATSGEPGLTQYVLWWPGNSGSGSAILSVGALFIRQPEARVLSGCSHPGVCWR
jgi:hypothetical protein